MLIVLGNITVILGGNNKLPLSKSNGAVCSPLKFNILENGSIIFECPSNMWISTITIHGLNNTSLSVCDVSLIGLGKHVMLYNVDILCVKWNCLLYHICSHIF